MLAWHNPRMNHQFEEIRPDPHCQDGQDTSCTTRGSMLDADDALQPHGDAALLQRLALGGGDEGLVRLDTAGWEIPQLAVRPLVNEQETIAAADHHDGEEPGRDRLA